MGEKEEILDIVKEFWSISGEDVYIRRMMWIWKNMRIETKINISDLVYYEIPQRYILPDPRYYDLLQLSGSVYNRFKCPSDNIWCNEFEVAAEISLIKSTLVSRGFKIPYICNIDFFKLFYVCEVYDKDYIKLIKKISDE